MFLGCATGRRALKPNYNDTMYTAISVYEEEYGEISEEAYDCVLSFVVIEEKEIKKCAGKPKDPVVTGCAVYEFKIIKVETGNRKPSKILCTAVHEYLHAIEGCVFDGFRGHDNKKIWNSKDENSILSKGCAVYKDFE
jgi:hypothetical protein